MESRNLQLTSCPGNSLPHQNLRTMTPEPPNPYKSSRTGGRGNWSSMGWCYCLVLGCDFLSPTSLYCSQPSCIMPKLRLELKWVILFGKVLTKLEFWNLCSCFNFNKVILSVTCLFAYLFRQSLTVVLRLASKLWSYCLSLLSAGIIGMNHHIQLQNGTFSF
jgi:hypothetical protein